MPPKSGLISYHKVAMRASMKVAMTASERVALCASYKSGYRSLLHSSPRSLCKSARVCVKIGGPVGHVAVDEQKSHCQVGLVSHFFYQCVRCKRHFSMLNRLAVDDDEFDK